MKADCTKHCSNFRSNPLAKEGDKTTISIRIVRATGNALRMKLAPPRFKTNPFQPISRPVQTSQRLESLQNFAQEFATFPRRGPRKFVLSNFRKTFASLSHRLLPHLDETIRETVFQMKFIDSSSFPFASRNSLILITLREICIHNFHSLK